MSATAIDTTHGPAGTDVAIVDPAVIDRILHAVEVDTLLRAFPALGRTTATPEAIPLDARVANLLRLAWGHAQRRHAATAGLTDVADVHAAIRASVHGPAPIPASPDHLPVSSALAAVLARAAQLARHEGTDEVRLAHLVRALLPKPQLR
jgi:hypothetical protein